eukprot:6998736-Alexandrium_andersonii.AAC.1
MRPTRAFLETEGAVAPDSGEGLGGAAAGVRGGVAATGAARDRGAARRPNARDGPGPRWRTVAGEGG